MGANPNKRLMLRPDAQQRANGDQGFGTRDAERANLLPSKITTPLLESIDLIGRMLNRLHTHLVTPTSP